MPAPPARLRLALEEAQSLGVDFERPVTRWSSRRASSAPSAGEARVQAGKWFGPHEHQAGAVARDLVVARVLKHGQRRVHPRGDRVEA